MLIFYFEFLLNLRKQNNISVKQISKKTGISQFRYLDFENGNIVPSDEEISAILAVYNLKNEDVLPYVKERAYYPVVFSKSGNKIKITIPTLWMIGATKEIEGDYLLAYNESKKMIKDYFKDHVFIPINPNHILTNEKEYLVMVKYN